MRTPTAGDEEGIRALLEECIGIGFVDPSDIDHRFSFVCAVEGQVVGAVLATLRPYAAMRDFYRDKAALLHWGVDPEPDVAGHIREVAVLPEFRRASVATRLLARSEATLGESGAAFFVANAWIRQDTLKSPGAHLLESRGYQAMGDIPGFFQLVGAGADVVCPACQDSPCACGARAFVKDTRASGAERRVPESADAQG